MSVNTKINGQLVKLAGLYDIGSSGILPKLIITSEAGDTLSVVSGSGKTITPTQVSGSTTEWECDIDSYGTCSVTSTLASETKYLDISEVKIYTLAISSVPQGSVVTPTDDIQTWLACAGIKDKSYTTLTEVLSDRETFEILIADSNACDYMARSTSWAGSSAGIVNSLDAMVLVGKYDYCSNALLNNATWAEAIVRSSYVDDVLNVKVPIMTSATTPSGTVSASSTAGSQQEPYRAFDGDTSTYWTTANNAGSGNWLRYQFPSSVHINAFTIATRWLANAYQMLGSYKIQGSNDASTWTDLYTETLENRDYGTIVRALTDSASYQYYQLLATSDSYYTSKNISVLELQFYGRTQIASQAIRLNPNMTSATTPYGEVITDATPLSNTQPYYAFDGTILDMFKAELANKYLGYIFETPTVVKRFTINSNQETAGQRWYKAKLQVSTDGTTWTDFDTYTNTDHANVFTVDIDNSTEYLGYRFYFLDDEITGACFINIIAFYGAPINTVIHSAKSDTIYTYIDGVQTTLTTTNYSKGIGYCDFSKLEAGTYTLYSSVAKNPNDLSQPYTKDIVITKTPYGNTTEVYFMPDTVKTLYWYGYESDELEDCISSNGWSYSGYSLVAPTHNTNDIYITGTSNTVSAYGTKNIISADTVHFIIKCGEYGRTFISNNKVASDGIEAIGTAYSSETHITKQSISSKYIGVEGYFGSPTAWVRLYAFWYE